MLTTLGIFIEFILIMLLMGYFIVYARAKSRQIAYSVKGDVHEANHWDQKRRLYSRIWHGIGLIMRSVFIIIVFFEFFGLWYHAILGTLISIFLSWTLFDRGINIVMGSDFWYIDSKNINKFIGKAYWTLTVMLIVGIIYWAIAGQKFFN